MKKLCSDFPLYASHLIADVRCMADFTPERIFGPKGLLSKKLPYFDYRASQVDYAKAVADAFANKQKALLEAQTGTGKTLGYLVPALESGRAGHYFHWNQSTAGTTLFQRHSATARQTWIRIPIALDERSHELSLPVEVRTGAK